MGRYEELMADAPPQIRQVFDGIFDDPNLTRDVMSGFDEADVDNSGELDAEELCTVVPRIINILTQRFPVNVGEFPDVTAEDVLQTLQEFDEDGSGTLSRGEFLDFSKTLLANFVVQMLLA